MVVTGNNALRCAAAMNEEDGRVLSFDEQDTLEQDSLELNCKGLATQHLGCPARLDLSSGGLERLPDSLLAFPGVRELELSRNRLGEAGEPDLAILARMPGLRVLRLAGNGLRALPASVLCLAAITHLDLADNGVAELPLDIHCMAGLQELRLERNLLSELPGTLARLARLYSLLVGHNLLSAVPAFLLAMRSLALLDLQGNRVASGKLPCSGQQDELNPLGRVNLRGNLLKGRIVLANYGGPWRDELADLGVPDKTCYRRMQSYSVPCPYKEEKTVRARSRKRHYDIENENNYPKEFEPVRCKNNRNLVGRRTPPRFTDVTNLQYRAVVQKHKDILPRLVRGSEANLQLRLDVSKDLHRLRMDGSPFQNLTQLDVSENSIESLDLSALTKLESVQCSRNQLVDLALNGKALVSLIAGNNKLQKLSINPPPASLQHLDVSYNELETLPQWTAGCGQLRALFASHNHLRCLPDHLFCGDLASLHTLQLSYNQLGSLPVVVRHISLQELFLQSNSIAMLPPNFLKAATRMRVLNLSNNRLCELPGGLERSDTASYQLEKLYLTANCLTDAALDVLAKFSNLRTLHAAYNCITTLPESCIAVWRDLEELVLSGNKLQYLPDNIVRLEHLRVLRVHSNRLQASPCFAKMTSLKVLDLAHNQLDRINLATLVPQQLQFLDLSCNSRLYVDPRQFQVYRTQRPMSLVDVSGQNRTCLPSTPYHEGGGNLEPPWKIGFSETAGQRERLYITQIRLPAFCNTEGLFGLFDGGNNNDVPNILIKAVPRILLEERTVKETANEYMKYTMLSAHRELKEKGQKYGVCATLCHIARTRAGNGPANGCGSRYVLRVASIGEAGAVLCRRSEGLSLAHTSKARSQLGCSAMFPLAIPDPHVTEILLEEQDEFLIVANKSFWEVVSMEEAVEEARHVGNAILAAKKLQDLAQSYGSEDNLSVLVVRFSHAGADVDELMRELRHTIRRTRQQHRRDDSDGPCCCRPVSAGGDGFYGGQIPRRHVCPDIGNIPDADRSSPSGQSDHASSDYIGKKGPSSRRPSIQHPRTWEAGSTRAVSSVKSDSLSSGRQHHQSVLMHENGTKKMGAVVPAMERRSYRDSKRSGGGVLKAIRSKLDGYTNGHLADAEEDETGSDRSGTQLSEEQFKCWEYMLEQNTQLLFDKELDTLSRGYPKPRPLLDRTMSRSSPHLTEPHTPSPAPFLSRHFGSARSFHPTSRSMRFGSGRQVLNGGPNAAYFGSLQRLMPYNLEYNFAVIQERGSNQDSLEQDGRMQQYWGVATTEL